MFNGNLQVILHILLAMIPLVICARSITASEAPVARAMGAADALEKGMAADKVRLNSAGDGLILYDHLLIEDDSPGISSTASWMKQNRSPSERLTGDVRVRKIIHLDRVGGLEARLYVPSGVALTINGQPVETARSTDYPIIPLEVLRQGYNEIDLAGRGRGQTVKMATRQAIAENDPQRQADQPRSFRSEDGGQSWQPVDGEFMVRLHLRQYAPEGSLLSPVIDFAGQDGAAPAGQVSLGRVGLKVDADVPEKTSLKMLIRSGSSPVVQDGLWTDWRAATEAAPAPAGHRYLQWKAVLRSDDPAATPTLRNITVEAAPQVDAPPDWAGGLRLTSSRNADIRYTSIPFAYEDPNHPKMVALREKYKLDEVIADGKSELEKMVLLRNWVASRWKYKPPAETYPAWDADEIITGKLGFCVQYAIVFMQCATSLGYQTRFVFGNHYGTGHEVIEYWSNEFEKWVMFDVNGNMHHLDTSTGKPMSMLELHDLVLNEGYGDKVATYANRPKGVVTSDAVATCYDMQLTPEKPKKPTPDGRFAVPMQWLHLRWMARNNFYAQPQPIPIAQGSHWDWADYICWDDARTPLQYRYRNFTSRRSDIEWTINQVRFDLAFADEQGQLRVQMGTVTPYFETFLVRRNDGDWSAADRTFDWKLQPGKNRLEMRVRNTSGILGPVSHVEVEFEN